MFIRSLLFGILGAITGAFALVLAAWFAGEAVPSQWIYLPSAAGFVGTALVNIASEYFDLYTTDLAQRLWRLKRQFPD